MITSDNIAQANEIMLQLISELQQTNPLPFGCDLAHADPHVVVHSTVCSRLFKKFERPDTSRTDELKDQCESKWIAFERDVCSPYTPYTKMVSSVRYSFYNQRLALREMLQSYKSPFKGFLRDVIPMLSESPLDFTPGETYHSLNGKVSLYQKLKERKCWTVTAGAIDDATKLVMAHRGLLVAAYKHAPEGFVSRIDLGSIYRRFCMGFKHLMRKKNDMDPYLLLLLTHMWHEELQLTLRFNRIRAYLCEHVFIVVDGSRGSSVPKNSETERFINIEPFFNMLMQRIVASKLRAILKRNGNDLEYGQSDHMKMIQSPLYATIDLKSGSDSTMLRYVEWALDGMDLLSDLQLTRSPFTWLGRQYKNYYQTKKLSAMGNGFTFEIMTCILLSACRLFDPTSRVYGDDIIIKNRHVNSLIPLLRQIGYQLNMDKTFISSPLRESCGAFYHDHIGYITCFEFKWINNPQDLFTCVNKLKRIIDAYDYDWIGTIEQAWKNIVSTIPLSYKGPDACVDDLGKRPIVDSHVVVSNSAKLKQQADPDVESLRSTLLTKAWTVLTAQQIKPHEVEFLICLRIQPKLASTPLYTYVGKGKKRRRYIVARDDFQILSWLEAGRVVKDVRRTDSDEYRFNEVICVSINGCTPFPVKEWLQPYA